MTEIGLTGVSWPWGRVPTFAFDNDVISQAIRDIIFTSLGERKMNQSYGSQVIATVFENKGEFLKVVAEREISLALRRHLPVVTLLNIDVRDGARDTGPVDIVVDYVFKGIGGTAVVSVSN